MASPIVTDAHSAVQLMMGLGCILIGLSHIAQPRVWQAYFAELHQQGHPGVLIRTMTWELWPALILVTLHQVWSGPGLVLTIYGWLLLAKCVISLLLPAIGLRSMALAQRGPGTFIAGGCLMLGIGSASAAALIWR